MAAVFLGIEMVIIVGQVMRGTTSHFNMTTPVNAALWQTMGVSIVLVCGWRHSTSPRNCSGCPTRTRRALWRSGLR